MADKEIQAQFGQAVIESISEFARKDIDTVEVICNKLAHVSEVPLRQTMAETLYGTRWLYQLGLALFVKDDEQLAHVRSQILDYSAVCESLLNSMVLFALDSNRINGSLFKFMNIKKRKGRINWLLINNKLLFIGLRGFEWNIEVATEFNIISHSMRNRLHGLRELRNTVHLPSRDKYHFLTASKKAYNTLCMLIDMTRIWKNGV